MDTLDSEKEDWLILQCPRCLYTMDWNRGGTKSPGDCPSCTDYYYNRSNFDWKVVKEHRKLDYGHIIVISDKGHQKLCWPSYKEHPDRWVK